MSEIKHIKPPAPHRAVRIQEPQAGRILAPHSGIQGHRRGDVPRSPLAAEERGEDAARTARNDQRRLLAGVLRRRRSGLPPGADGRARLAVRDLAHRLERSGQRSDPPSVHSARLDAASGSSAPDARLAARTGRLAGSGSRAPLRRQSALPSAQHVSGVLPLLHAQLRDRPRHRERRQSRRSRRRPSSGKRRSSTSRSGPNSKTS